MHIINHWDSPSVKMDKFIENAIEIHGNAYSYEKVFYTRGHDKVIITCRIHGDFMQSPSNHIHKGNPRGCPTCGSIKGGIKKTLTHLKTRNWDFVQPKEYKLIPLYKRGFTKVSNDKFDLVKDSAWVLSASGYVIDSKSKVYLHRLLTNCPKDMVVDHKNHDTLDNRCSNLRVCSNKENVRNARLRSDSTTMYKGVHLDKEKRKFLSSIFFNGKNIFLGYFENKIDAARAYDKKAKELFGEFAYLNFKEDETI